MEMLGLAIGDAYGFLSNTGQEMSDSKFLKGYRPETVAFPLSPCLRQKSTPGNAPVSGLMGIRKGFNVALPKQTNRR